MSTSESDRDDSSVDLSLLSEGSGDEGGAQADAAPTSRRRQHAQQPADGSTDYDQQEGGGGGAAEEASPEGGQEGGDKADNKQKKKKKKVSKVLSKVRLQRLQEKHERRGIVYVSRIPPHMKPAKLRQLLAQYGEIGRVYCAPEDSAVRKKRKQHGGNTGAFGFVSGGVGWELLAPCF
jgi:ESF2/ABP1 family protein